MKKRQYIVTLNGNTVNAQQQTYTIKSVSEEEACLEATKRFNEEYAVIDSESIQSIAYNRTSKSFWAIVFMIIPFLLSCISWKSGHDSISIAPNFISTLYAVLFYATFILRFKGVRNSINTVTDMLLSVSVILLLSSLLRTILFTKDLTLFGIFKIPVDTNIALVLCILLSLVGIKLVSAFLMLFVMIIGICNIAILSDAMGPFCGTLFAICTFFGITFYCSVEPAFSENKMLLTSTFNKALQFTNNNFQQIEKTTNTIKIKMKENNKIGVKDTNE